MADDLIADLVALLENLNYSAALLPFSGRNLLHGVHEVGVKGFCQRFDLGNVEIFQRFGRFVQRHHNAFFIVLVGAGGVGGHVQRIQNAQDLGDGVRNAVVEFLICLALGALAVVIILRRGAQQLIFQLSILLFAGLQFGLQRSFGVMVFFFLVRLIGLLLGSSLSLCLGFGGLCSLFRLGRRGFFFLFVVGKLGYNFNIYLTIPAKKRPNL